MEYFKNFNWHNLECQKMAAPAIPKISEEKYNKSQYLLSYLQK